MRLHYNLHASSNKYFCNSCTKKNFNIHNLTRVTATAMEYTTFPIVTVRPASPSNIEDVFIVFPLQQQTASGHGASLKVMTTRFPGLCEVTEVGDQMTKLAEAEVESTPTEDAGAIAKSHNRVPIKVSPSPLLLTELVDERELVINVFYPREHGDIAKVKDDISIDCRAASHCSASATTEATDACTKFMDQTEAMSCDKLMNVNTTCMSSDISNALNSVMADIASIKQVQMGAFANMVQSWLSVEEGILSKQADLFARVASVEQSFMAASSSDNLSLGEVTLLDDIIVEPFDDLLKSAKRDVEKLVTDSLKMLDKKLDSFFQKHSRLVSEFSASYACLQRSLLHAVTLLEETGCHVGGQ